MPDQKPYYIPLDGLRGLAALMVIFFHMAWFPAGWMGVQCLFVLSAFLITGNLLRSKSEKYFAPASGEKYFARAWKDFFAKRALRIFPLYFGFLILLAIAFFITGVPEEFSRAWKMLFTFSYNFFRAQDDFPISQYFVHFWSLCMEEQFYLVAPLLILLLPKRWIAWALIAMCFLAPLCRYFLAESLKAKPMNPDVIGDVICLNTFCMMDAFAVGGLIALLREKNFFNSPGLISSVLILLFVCAGWTVFYFSTGEINANYFYNLGFERTGLFLDQHVYTFTFTNLGFAGVIIALISGKNKFIERVFSNSLLVFAGKISFGVYVFHYPVIRILKDYFAMNTESWFSPLIVIPLTFAIASLSYFLYEKRFLELKKHFA